MVKFFYKKTTATSASELSSAAHCLLKNELAAYFGVNQADIEIKKDSRGAPFIDFVDGVFVSLTHTKGLVACAFADSRIGIDAEFIKTRRKSVESRVFTDGEINLLDSAEEPDVAFFVLWTLKESWLKAKGTGFADNAKEIEFDALENPVLSNQKNCEFSVEKKDGYALSLCVFKSEK